MALSENYPAIHSHALTNLGLALSRVGDPAAPATLEEGLRVALAAGEPEHACRAYLCLAGHYLDNLGLAEAERWLAEGIEFAEGSEFLVYSRYLQMELATLRFATGDWDEVAAAAAPAMEGSPPFRCAALTVAGRTRLRRGEPGAREMLREAWRLAVPLAEPQRLGPAAAALAEAAALDGDAGAALPELTEAFETVRTFGRVLWRAELAYWLGRAGRPVGGQGLDHPYAMQADGRWRPAAEAWRAAGFPYEHAVALTESPEVADQIAALGVLDGLGARPLARLVRARLRDRGVAGVPRGPAAATRVNPAGLTARQAEVVRLMAGGLSNAEIADRLVLSVRTVESHVAAALGKLGTGTRREAAARASELGILDARPRT